MVDRRPEMLVILAILRAGGAYVPIDPVLSNALSISSATPTKDHFDGR